MPTEEKLFIHDSMVWYIFKEQEHKGDIVLNIMQC